MPVTVKYFVLLNLDCRNSPADVVVVSHPETAPGSLDKRRGNLTFVLCSSTALLLHLLELQREDEELPLIVFWLILNSHPLTFR